MGKMQIPARDKKRVASPRPVISPNAPHEEQISAAFNLGFKKYEKAMKKLSEI